jgi:hypothetical protein
LGSTVDLAGIGNINVSCTELLLERFVHGHRISSLDIIEAVATKNDSRFYFRLAFCLKGFSAACKLPPVLQAKLDVSLSAVEKHLGHRRVQLVWLNGIRSSN